MRTATTAACATGTASGGSCTSGATGTTGRRPTAADAEALRAKVARYAPAWVAFHGKGTAAAYALAAGHRPPPLGRAPWVVGGSPVFVLPSASGANRRASYDGRPTRLEWWQELAALLG